MDAVTAAGHPCDVLDGYDDRSDYGEESNNCGTTHDPAVTYCPTAAVCRQLIANIRENLKSTTAEHYVLDGGTWLVLAPYSDLQEIRSHLGGSVTLVSGSATTEVPRVQWSLGSAPAAVSASVF